MNRAHSAWRSRPWHGCRGRWLQTAPSPVPRLSSVASGMGPDQADLAGLQQVLQPRVGDRLAVGVVAVARLPRIASMVPLRGWVMPLLKRSCQDHLLGQVLGGRVLWKSSSGRRAAGSVVMTSCSTSFTGATVWTGARLASRLMSSRRRVRSLVSARSARGPRRRRPQPRHGFSQPLQPQVGAAVGGVDQHGDDSEARWRRPPRRWRRSPPISVPRPIYPATRSTTMTETLSAAPSSSARRTSASARRFASGPSAQAGRSPIL